MSPLARSLLALACAALLRAACAGNNDCTHLTIGTDDINEFDLKMEFLYDFEPVLPTFPLPIPDYCYENLTHNLEVDGNYELRFEELTVCAPVKLEPFGFSHLDVTTPAGEDGPFRMTVVQYCRLI